MLSLQRALYTSTIPYKLVLSILETNGLDKQIDERYPVQPFQLTKIVYEIYFAADKLGYFKNFSAFNLESAISVIITFIWRVFDPRRTNSIFLVEIKEMLLILCQVNSMQNLMTELFALVCNQNRCISLQRLQLLLSILIKLLIEIGEGASYGLHNMIKIMEQCYVLYPGVIGIDEYQFKCLWSGKETQFQMYANLLALVKRMNDTQQLIHKTQCAGCQKERIIGIRFKCKKCKELSLCMKCFSIGFENKSHIRNHVMFEVFTEGSIHKPKHTILKKICSTLCFLREFKDKEDTVQIYRSTGLEYDVNFDFQSEFISLVEISLTEPKKDKNIQFEEHSIRQSEIAGNLRTLNNFLMDQSDKLQKHISLLPSNFHKDFLISHQTFLNEITNRMDLLIEQTKNQSFPISSTPRRISLTNDNASVVEKLSKSIHGASINLSYLEANKSDNSTKDVSRWYRKDAIIDEDQITNSNEIQSNIEHFRSLLHKVKDIIEDSYSDIVELTNATHNVENIVEKIIQEEESKRYFVIDV